MNINRNRKYFTIAVYATCAVIVSAIAVMVIFNFDSVMAKLSVLGAVTTPIDRKSTRLNSSHPTTSRMPSSA